MRASKLDSKSVKSIKWSYEAKKSFSYSTISERERDHLGIYWWISFSCFLDYSYDIEAFLCLKLCRWTVLARCWSDFQCIFLSCWAYKHVTDENKWQYFVNNEMVAIYRASQMSSYMHLLDIIASLALLCKIHKTLLSDIWYALVSHWMHDWYQSLFTVGCKLLWNLTCMVLYHWV